MSTALVAFISGRTNGSLGQLIPGNNAVKLCFLLHTTKKVWFGQREIQLMGSLMVIGNGSERTV
jgi:hypothetical protein